MGVLAGVLSLLKLKKSGRISNKLAAILVVQLFVVILSVAIVYSTSTSLQRREGLPVVNQVASWVIIGNTICFFFYFISAYTLYRCF